MKITCDACGAKYSIADEKVAGKAFKIRCKKCSGSIVVRQDQPQAQEEAPATQEDLWHVVVGAEQQGPLSLAKVGELIATGAIDWDAYVWQEGYDDWKVARDVPELVSGIAQGEAPSAARPPLSADSASSPDQGGVFNDPDEEEVTRAQTADDIFKMTETAAPSKISRASSAAGADLFSQPSRIEATAERPFSESPFGGGFGQGGESPGALPRSEATSADPMTGSRNETSVLFSLSNLKQLKTSTPSQPNVATSPNTPATAASTNDASGLIDIRALAAAAASTSASTRQPKDASLADAVLQSHQGTVPLAPLSAPTLRPESSGGPSNRLLYIGFAVVTLLALTAIVLLVVFMLNKPETQPVMASGPAGTAAPGAENQAPGSTGAEPPNAPAPGQPQTTNVPGASANAEKSEAANTESARKDRGSSSRRASGSRSTTPSTETAEPPKKSSGSIDDLLDQAIGGAGSSKSQAASSNLPDTPGRSDVMAAMRQVQSNVQSCGQGKSGVAQTAVKVAGASGRVSGVQVTGVFAGTPVARCIVNAVRGATFPKFRRTSFGFSYPFRL
ncbi:MAG: zinc-ribbon domain-containing protein [Myxococcales bacterium]|nr:zinc-ribbon domain-containing protein [Myxococcales bacterium]MCB9707959.1 zinc-ribbon domain-containing protein [Myxococcales bacterium]